MPAGINTVDFGALTQVTLGFASIEEGDAVTTISGQAGLLAGSFVDAWVAGVATADHSADEHMVESLRAVAGNIVPGVGFDIRVTCTRGPTYGLFSVEWAWQ